MKEMSIIKPNTKGFSIECKNESCIGGRIETTMEGDSGYSNWTILESGKLALKCHGCGKYGSTYEYDEPNELYNFKITCLNCNCDEWDFNCGDVEGEDPTYLECKVCGQRVLEREN